MSNDNQELNPAESVPTQQPESQDAGNSVANGDSEILDKVTALAEALEESNIALVKAQSDRDNYKSGLLGAKAKLKEVGLDDDDAPQLSEDRIAQIVAEQLKAVLPTITQPKDEVIEKSQRVISELKTALANRQGISNAPVGSGGDKTEVTASYFSKEQVANLKARGWDDAKIKMAEERSKA